MATFFNVMDDLHWKVTYAAKAAWDWSPLVLYFLGTVAAAWLLAWSVGTNTALLLLLLYSVERKRSA